MMKEEKQNVPTAQLQAFAIGATLLVSAGYYPIDLMYGDRIPCHMALAPPTAKPEPMPARRESFTQGFLWNFVQSSRVMVFAASTSPTSTVLPPAVCSVPPAMRFAFSGGLYAGSALSHWLPEKAFSVGIAFCLVSSAILVGIKEGK